MTFTMNELVQFVQEHQGMTPENRTVVLLRFLNTRSSWPVNRLSQFDLNELRLILRNDNQFEEFVRDQAALKSRVSLARFPLRGMCQVFFGQEMPRSIEAAMDGSSYDFDVLTNNIREELLRRKPRGFILSPNVLFVYEPK